MFLSLSCLPISEGDSVKVQCDWRAGVRDHIGRGAPQLCIRHPRPDCSVIKDIVVTLLTEGRTKMEMQILTPRPVSVFDDVSVPGHPPPLSSEHPALLFCRGVGMMMPVSARTLSTAGDWRGSSEMEQVLLLASPSSSPPPPLSGVLSVWRYLLVGQY